MIQPLVLAAALLFSPGDLTGKPWLGRLDTAGWSLVGMTLKKDRVNLYKPLSSQEHGRLRYGWLRLEYETKPPGSSKTLYAFDCAARTTLTLDTFDYLGKNLSGGETDEETRLDRSTYPLKFLPANSPVARAFNIACASSEP